MEWLCVVHVFCLFLCVCMYLCAYICADLSLSCFFYNKTKKLWTRVEGAGWRVREFVWIYVSVWVYVFVWWRECIYGFALFYFVLFCFVYMYMYVRLHSYTNIIFIDFFNGKFITAHTYQSTGMQRNHGQLWMWVCVYAIKMCFFVCVSGFHTCV